MLDLQAKDRLPLVLVIGPDRGQCEAFASALDVGTCRVRHAASLQEAMVAVRESVPVLLAVDAGIFGDNAREILKQIQEAIGILDTPILIFAVQDRQAVDVALSSGGASGLIDWVPEPFSSVEAKARVRAYLHLAERVQSLAKGKVVLEAAIAEVRQAAEKAEAGNRSRGAFLANVTHEIRTAMNSIIGFVDVLHETALDERQMDYVGTVRRNSDVLLALVNDILDFSKIEAGSLKMEEIETALGSLGKEVCEAARTRLQRKPVAVVLSVDPGVPEKVLGDPLRVRQVLNNLVNNACKFTEQGRIELFLSVDEVKEGRVKVHVEVRDTGIGIPQKQLATIFTPFAQAEESTARRFGGSGLGLSISRQLASLMGGEIWAQSEEGRGSTFHFTAWFRKMEGARSPVAVSAATVTPGVPAVAVAPAVPAAVAPVVSVRVLLAEDSPDSRKLAEFMLTRAGHKVESAANGRQAVEKYAAAPDKYDLILMDVQMPEMDGFEATKEIRRLGHVKVPIIAMTAYAMKGYREKCLAEGMSDYVTKPIKKETIQEIVTRWGRPEGGRGSQA